MCEAYFGRPRQTGTSHHVYAAPWDGDPRVNIQNRGGQATPYQVRQAAAIDKLVTVDDESSASEEGR